MGRRFPGANPLASSVPGEFNKYQIYWINGTHNWEKPAGIAGDRILVHVWGAGGTGHHGTANTAGNQPKGGGGGGLAVKYIDVSSLNSTETITVGEGYQLSTTQGGTSSFGSHCSASGGNGGGDNTVNQGSAAEYGVGGLGIGGDVNKRGGSGGTAYWAAASNVGGSGGGSAPAPYGVSDGFTGGEGYTYGGGGGAGIGGNGGYGSYTGGGGGGSAAPGHDSANSSYFACGSGGNGILGPGGVGSSNYLGYVSYGGASAETATSGEGTLILDPNTIIFGGGGGGGGTRYRQSSLQTISNGAPGGPGGGGGGVSNNTTTAFYGVAGGGGPLGGGGGACHYCSGGNGGSAGGGGGGGGSDIAAFGGFGGHGLVIVQFKVK